MRWPVGIFFITHGLGHTMGFLAASTRLDVGFTDDSWILPGGVTSRTTLVRRGGCSDS